MLLRQLALALCLGAAFAQIADTEESAETSDVKIVDNINRPRGERADDAELPPPRDTPFPENDLKFAELEFVAAAGFDEPDGLPGAG